MNGVVYIAGGCRNTGKLAKADLPALVIRGSRDPFIPEKVTPTTAVNRLLNAEERNCNTAVLVFVSNLSASS